jgi:hypothetical protein
VLLVLVLVLVLVLLVLLLLEHEGGCTWRRGGKKGLAVTKGMTETGTRALDAVPRRLHWPRRVVVVMVVKQPVGVAGFIAGARPGTLMNRKNGILLLDKGGTATSVVVGVEMEVLLRNGGDGRGGGGSLATPFAAPCASFIGCGHSGMQRREVAHHSLILLLFVCVDCLGVLTEVV